MQITKLQRNHVAVLKQSNSSNNTAAKSRLQNPQDSFESSKANSIAFKGSDDVLAKVQSMLANIAEDKNLDSLFEFSAGPVKNEVLNSQTNDTFGHLLAETISQSSDKEVKNSLSQILEYGITKGLDISIPNNYDKTALQIIEESKHYPTILMLERLKLRDEVMKKLKVLAGAIDMTAIQVNCNAPYSRQDYVAEYLDKLRKLLSIFYK